MLLPMDSLEIEGKEYISARRAAREHGYVADYIGQLIRNGKIQGKKVGRSWYVESDSLNAYIRTDYEKSSQFGNADNPVPMAETKPAVAENTEAALAAQGSATVEIAEAAPIPKAEEASTYELLRYLPEEEAALPALTAEKASRVALRAIVRTEERTEEADSLGGEAPAYAAGAPHGADILETHTEPFADPLRRKGGAKNAFSSFMGTLSYALSVLVALAGIAAGTMALVAVKEVGFEGSNLSASAASVRDLYLEITR